MELKVQSLKIVSNKVELTEVEHDPVDGNREYVDRDKRALVHPDLTRALGKLRIHAAVQLRLVSPKQIKHVEEPDEKLVEFVQVYGVTYSGGDERNEAVQILCRLTCLGGAPLSCALPPQRFDGPAENRYVFMPELVRVLAEVNEEFEGYADGTKRGSEPHGGEKAVKPKKEKVTHARVAPPEDKATKTAQGTKIPQADEEAQRRVASDGTSFDGTAGEYQEEIDKGKKKGGTKKPQSPENPGGK